MNPTISASIQYCERAAARVVPPVDLQRAVVARARARRHARRSAPHLDVPDAVELCPSTSMPPPAVPKWSVVAGAERVREQVGELGLLRKIEEAEVVGGQVREPDRDEGWASGAKLACRSASRTRCMPVTPSR